MVGRINSESILAEGLTGAPGIKPVLKFMKTTVGFFIVAIALLTAAIPARADLVAGPITNPANGYEYFLLTPNTWSASEAEAEALGGTLVVIRNAAEQAWVFSQFGAYGGTNRNLWIGLHRQWQGGPLAWVTDEKLAYVNWARGNPDNAGGVENCVHIYNPKDVQAGQWNDYSDTATQPDPICGVVEVLGKSTEAALTAREKSLVGNWYNNGDPDQPCWIAGTDKLLFAIDQSKDASRLIETPERFLFSPKWKQHLILLEGKILWSRGNWWSQKPVKFKMAAAAAEKDSGDKTSDVIR